MHRKGKNRHFQSSALLTWTQEAHQRLNNVHHCSDSSDNRRINLLDAVFRIKHMQIHRDVMVSGPSSHHDKLLML